MSPLALMIRPHGSSPHHSLALVLALTAIRASKPLPLVHIISLTPSMPIALAAKTPIEQPRRSGGDRPVVILAAPGHQREDDAGDLVGERHRCQLELVLDGLALEHAARPWAHAVVVAFAMTKRRAGAYDQKLAQIAVAHLGDAPEPLLAPARVLARRQAEEGGELAPAGEGAGVLDGGHDRRGGDRADAGNGHQPLGCLIGLDRRCDLLVDRSDRLVERINLADKRTKRHPDAVGNYDLAVRVKAVDGQALEVIGMAHTPCGPTTPISARCPRKALSAAVRWPASSSRARWCISSAWLSIERTGTNRWPSRPIAS